MSGGTVSAESSPTARRVAKFAILVAWVAATLAAMAMTLDVVVAKAGDAPEPWLLWGLVAVGLGLDLWVGAGPLAVLAAVKWRLRSFAALGILALVLAIFLTFTNKIEFWGSRADARQDTAQRLELVRGVDTLSADRALVAGAGPLRPLPALEAELAGRQQELAALVERGVRPRLQTELRAQVTQLEAEAATVRAVEAARARLQVAAGLSPDSVAATSRVARETSARDRWLADALTAVFRPPQPVDPHQVEAWMNGLWSFFHELFCLVGLTLATLGRPVWAIQAEAAAVAEARSAKRRAKLLLKRELDRLEAEFVADQPLPPGPDAPPESGPTPAGTAEAGPRFGAAGRGWRWFARDQVRDPNLTPPPAAPGPRTDRPAGGFLLPGKTYAQAAAEQREAQRLAAAAALSAKADRKSVV